MEDPCSLHSDGSQQDGGTGAFYAFRSVHVELCHVKGSAGASDVPALTVVTAMTCTVLCALQIMGRMGTCDAHRLVLQSMRLWRVSRLFAPGPCFVPQDFQRMLPCRVGGTVSLS